MFRWILPLLIGVGMLTGVGVFGYRHYQQSLVDQHIKQGRTAFQEGNYPRARELAEQIVHSSPESEAGWKLLAEASSRDHHEPLALEALQRYSRLNPVAGGKLCISLGSYWMEQNRTRPAWKALRLAESLGRETLPSLQLQEQIAAVTGHARETVRCILELLKLGKFTRGDLIIVTALFPGLADLPRLEAILAADPENKAPLLAKAQSELSRNRHDLAERLLLEIVQAHPDEIEAIGMLAELYAEHRPQKFPAWHRALPEWTQDDSRIWSARGKWLSQAGYPAEAIRCLHESLLREPEQLFTTSLLGQLLKAQGEIELGQAYLDRAERLQRITDLNRRLNEPRAREYVLPMAEELVATGRLWEAWGWCVIHQTREQPHNPKILALRELLEQQLSPELPRTLPDILPGQTFSWERFPLPNWSRIRSPSITFRPLAASAATGIRFVDRAAEVGLEMRYVNSTAPESGRKIFETMGAGVAVLDYDQDGWPDLYFPQGNTSPTETADGPSDRLYRNDRGLRFTNVTEHAGIQDVSYSQGVSAGDYDNDGFPDIYVANLGRNRLYRNNGDGTFADVTSEAGLQQQAWTVSCAIADLNLDGMPELFDVNYIAGTDYLTRVCLDARGVPRVCRPTVFEAAVDSAAINLGDGRFQEQQSAAGLDLPEGKGLGLLVFDANGDHKPDVFIANDMTANYLLINAAAEPGPSLHFQDEAVIQGVAFDRNGLAQACMGIASADLNRDGVPDFFVTNFSQESNTLYLSDEQGSFEDRTHLVGLRDPSFDMLGFGTQFLDADRDGWHDLVVANGHIDEFENELYRMRLQFFRGLPDGRFVELFAAKAGPLFDQPRLGRGLALVDWNRDGRTDFVVTDLEDSIILAENRTESSQRALQLKLIGTPSSRDAIGAKIRVRVAADDVRFAQLMAGDGYESSNERRIDIGVGNVEQIDEIEIQWPSGRISRAAEVRPDRVWLVIENREDWLWLP